jgi:hypothetical protein
LGEHYGEIEIHVRTHWSYEMEEAS